MDFSRILLVTTFVLFISSCGPSSPIVTPSNPKVYSFEGDPSTQGPFEQAIGIYWHGKLVDGTDIGFGGPGFIKLFRERKTGWATFDLFAVIRKGIEKLGSQFPNQEPVQIGDIGLRNGGPIGGHSSHQNGLDADIRLLSKDHHVQMESDNTGFDEDFVVKGKVSANLDLPRNWALIKGLVSTGRVERIFTNSLIKQELCKYAKSIGEQGSFSEVLHKLRHEENHTDHFHIRITCPQNSRRCLSSDPLPAGTGC